MKRIEYRPTNDDAKRMALCLTACAGLDIPDNAPVGAISDVVKAAHNMLTTLCCGHSAIIADAVDELDDALAKLGDMR